MTFSAVGLQSAGREMRHWAEPLGRFGFAAKGAIYVLIGTLAAQAAAGMGGDATGSEGALRRIVQLPFGRVLLAAVALGLRGSALWRFIQAYKDTENKGSQGKGLAIRAGYAVIALIVLPSLQRTVPRAPEDRLGRAGFAARGVVFCLAGALVILGAMHADPANARGLEGALEVLERQRYAPWLFGLVAVGLVAYGLFQWVLARYRRMVIR